MWQKFPENPQTEEEFAAVVDSIFLYQASKPENPGFAEVYSSIKDEIRTKPEYRQLVKDFFLQWKSRRDNARKLRVQDWLGVFRFATIRELLLEFLDDHLVIGTFTNLSPVTKEGFVEGIRACIRRVVAPIPPDIGNEVLRVVLADEETAKRIDKTWLLWQENLQKCDFFEWLEQSPIWTYLPDKVVDEIERIMRYNPSKYLNN